LRLRRREMEKLAKKAHGTGRKLNAFVLSLVLAEIS